MSLKKIFLFVYFLSVSCSITVLSQNEQNNGTEDLEDRVQALENVVKKLNKLKISGYLQTQFQYGEKDASLNVGGNNENKDKGFNRFGIRRGRLKFTYEENIASGVIQIDLTDKKGVTLKDAYLKIKDPWYQTSAIKGGIFDRPFGYEISYSSSKRESPERSTVFRALFPEERDLGLALFFQPPGTSVLKNLRFEAGFFSGNGIKKEIDNKKDFIGHLSFSGKLKGKLIYGIGASYYHGFVYQGSENIYEMEDYHFILDNDPDHIGKFSKRQYAGLDAQLKYLGNIGSTQLRAEYLVGKQPGGKDFTGSPNSGSLSAHDIYLRKFNGGYIMLIQEIGKLPLSAVVKYDWYDPNTQTSGKEIGYNTNTGIADMAQYTIGFGVVWNIYENLGLQAYYEINEYEDTDLPEIQDINLNDLEMNVFTLRLQYKF